MGVHPRSGASIYRGLLLNRLSILALDQRNVVPRAAIVPLECNTNRYGLVQVETG